MHISSFSQFIAESDGAHAYELHYTASHVRGMLKGNSEGGLIKKITAMKDVSEWSLFANKSGFHSTADEKYLVKWWDKGNDYWSNRAKKEPELLKKKHAA